MTKYIAKVFFHDDRKLAIHFMNTENLDLMGTPKTIILNGNPQKVLDYIEAREYDMTHL